MSLDIPLIIPEVNADHLALNRQQQAERGWSGLIITSPNCTTTGIVMPIKPLDEAFGLGRIFAATMQAFSIPGTKSAILKRINKEKQN